MSFGLTIALVLLIVLIFPWTMAKLCKGTSTDPDNVFSNAVTLPPVPGEFRHVWMSAAWIAVTLGLVGALLRLFFRVGWEAAAVLILLEEYSLGVVVAGYIIAAVVMIMVAAQFYVGHYLSSFCGLKSLSQIIVVIEIGACCLMFRWAEPNTLSLACFIVGSFALYAANQLTSTVFNAVMMTYIMPGHPVLDVESMNLMLNAACFLGTFLGPSISRYFLSLCFHQNTFAGFVLVVAILQACIVELGLRGIASDPEHYFASPRRGSKQESHASPSSSPSPSPPRPPPSRRFS